MSKALVIGGDRIEGIKQVLQAQGINKIDHWTGRKPQCDCAGHRLAQSFHDVSYQACGSQTWTEGCLYAQ